MKMDDIAEMGQAHIERLLFYRRTETNLVEHITLRSQAAFYALGAGLTKQP